VIGFGFTRGDVSTVAVAVDGQNTTAKVAVLPGGASDTGAYAVSVPLRSGQANQSDISTIIGYASSHAVVTQLLSCARRPIRPALLVTESHGVGHGELKQGDDDR